jgi:hypothetical protein
MEYRALNIGGQQRSVERLILTLMLCQQQVVVLDNRVLQCPLNFGDQATFAVKALKRGRLGLGVSDQAIKRVVAIEAKQILLREGHWVLRAIKIRTLEYL